IYMWELVIPNSIIYSPSSPNMIIMFNYISFAKPSSSFALLIVLLYLFCFFSLVLNGKVVNSCLVLMVQIPARSEVETIESIDSVVISLQDSFIEKGATQCGACTPGMIMTTMALLREKPNADLNEIREGLSGVICRCTGYQKIFDAIKDTQQRLKHE
ncbi:MAG: (2Fe-2S)-binding protein, partial [Candidatus Hodarchaeota archaeon]